MGTLIFPVMSLGRRMFTIDPKSLACLLFRYVFKLNTLAMLSKTFNTLSGATSTLVGNLAI
jgi:hypothetical protein